MSIKSAPKMTLLAEIMRVLRRGDALTATQIMARIGKRDSRRTYENLNNNPKIFENVGEVRDRGCPLLWKLRETPIGESEK